MNKREQPGGVILSPEEPRYKGNQSAQNPKLSDKADTISLVFFEKILD